MCMLITHCWLQPDLDLGSATDVLHVLLQLLLEVECFYSKQTWLWRSALPMRQRADVLYDPHARVRLAGISRACGTRT